MSVAAARVRAWAAGRSIARRLPAPIEDHGGFRVDTGSAAETCRWIFPQAGEGLAALGQTLAAPGFAIKLCDETQRLRALLPAWWRMDAASWMMETSAPIPHRPLPDGYRLQTEDGEARTAGRIVDAAGDLAARGFLGIAEGAAVFDRIMVEPSHRRRGLGAALMAALDPPGWKGDRLLVATADGRALYETLGWRVIAPYASATIPYD